MGKKFYILIIALGSVFIIALAVILLMFLSRKKRLSRQHAALKEKYDGVFTQLTSDCQVMIKRLAALGKYNVKFQNHFNERNKQYEEIIDNRSTPIRNALDSIQKCIVNKEYSKAKESLVQVEINIDEFSKSVSNFGTELSNILRVDSDTSEASLSIKNKYHKILSFYNEHKSELKAIDPAFQCIFKYAEDTFTNYSTLTDRAQYDEAKALLPQLDNMITALLDIVEDLPTYVNLTTVGYPTKIQEIEKKYTDLINEGYYLDYLLLPNKIASMNASLKTVMDNLNVLDVTDVKETLDSIRSEITEIEVKLNQEISAKKTFENSQDNIQTSTFAIEQDYSKYINELPNYEATYILDKKYTKQIRNLNDDIQDISYIKRELDIYLDTDDKRPYTIICEKMNTMNNKIEKVKKTMSDYANYLESLKETAQDVYIGLRKYYTLLKKAQFEVKTEIGVTSYMEATQVEFDRLLNEIKEIDKIIFTQPIDVNKAKEKFAPFSTDCDKLISTIKIKIVECKNAETALVYANAYRIDFVDSRNMLDKAENAFLEGDFDRAKKEATEVIRLFNAPEQTQAN